MITIMLSIALYWFHLYIHTLSMFIDVSTLIVIVHRFVYAHISFQRANVPKPRLIAVSNASSDPLLGFVIDD